MKKTCTKCQEPKQLSQFSKTKNGKYGVHSYCKNCIAILKKIRYANNKDSLKERYQQNKEEISKKRKLFYKKNKAKINTYSKNYYKKNIIQIKKRTKDNANPVKEKIRRELFKKNNPEYFLNYFKKRKAEDPLFRLRCNISALINCSMKKRGFKKNSKTAQILGCSFLEFKEHIEKQFNEHMSWDNAGTYWEFDHIKPMALAKTEQEVIELNHYTNFQPLYWLDNKTKGKKYEH